MKDATKRDYGFIVPKLTDSPNINKIVRTAEDLYNANIYSQVCIFNSYNGKVMRHSIPVLHLNQSKFFYGNLFLFDIQSVLMTNTYPNIFNRYFYATNIPWEKNNTSNYKEWLEVFGSENLQIIAQNQHIADLFEICWKKPILIAQDFTYDQIQSIVE